ncbi:MAG: hypothetical protein EOO25_04480 [Comamonadaceae bacterium]|nr:MAG: hypothetical protein EOO25_04480 [Comamonadaceae bacterium]
MRPAAAVNCVAIVLAGLLLAVGTGAAMAGPLQVQTLSYQGPGRNGIAVDAHPITMPFVRSPDPAVAARINDLLFIARHRALSPRRPGQTFGAADGIAVDGQLSEHFEVLRNDGRILSLVFEGEGCGAYCEDFRQAYAFDARTGLLFTAENVVTPAGWRQLDARMRRESIRLYRAQLATLAQELKQARQTASVGDISDTQERIAFNQACLQAREADTATAHAAPHRVPETDRYRFEFGPSAITFVAGRCSNHALRALDDVDSVRVSLPYAAAGAMLTPYARAVLAGRPATPPEAVFGQLLRGSLSAAGSADLAVTMLLNRLDDGSLAGTYFYGHIRQPIDLSGAPQGAGIRLTEDAGDTSRPRHMKPVFTLSRSADGLAGTWTGERTLGVRLHP